MDSSNFSSDHKRQNDGLLAIKLASIRIAYAICLCPKPT